MGSASVLLRWASRPTNKGMAVHAWHTCWRCAVGCLLQLEAAPPTVKAPSALLQRYWALAQVGQRSGAAAGVRARPNRMGGVASGPAALVVVVVKPLLAGTPSAQQWTVSDGSDFQSRHHAMENIAKEAPPPLHWGGTMVKWLFLWRWG